MKVIFLDIDGVLNCYYTKERIYVYTFIMDCKIELLKQLVERTGAKIVLSSTWRQGWVDLEDGKDTMDAKCFVALRNKLLEFGVELMDYTPITNGAMNRRGEEIDMWFKTWKGEEIESYVLIDDLNGCYLRPHSGRLIRTSMVKGLLQKHVDLAAKILNTPLDRAENEKPVAPAVLVDYRCPHDCEIERCEMMKDPLTEDTICSHCNRLMSAGEKAVFLFPVEEIVEYVICPECAKKSCTEA